MFGPTGSVKNGPESSLTSVVLRDSDLIGVGIIMYFTGAVLQSVVPWLTNNYGAGLALYGTAFVITGLVVLLVGLLRFVRRVETSLFHGSDKH